jgi:hypothetical protein
VPAAPVEPLRQPAAAPPPPVNESASTVATAAPAHGPGRPKLAYTGVAFIAIGAAALVAGAALVGHASALNDEFNHPRDGMVYDHTKIDQWQREQNAAIGLFAAGGAVVVTGSIMTAVGWRRPRDGTAAQAWQITPVIGSRLLGASVRLSF